MILTSFMIYLYFERLIFNSTMMANNLPIPMLSNKDNASEIANHKEIRRYSN